MGGIDDVPNTQKQIQKDCQNIKTRKCAAKERTEEKSQEKVLNKMKASNLPDTGFETMVIQVLKELRGRMNELSENLNKEIVNVKGTSKP